ncbi:hypothetical protein TrispH2_007114 [Trichoplax sp. H2]|nr:hypothetical protein TrispH2_007114 [Trichoplax sp. H2]|eukprot:RDD40528.1 hypothetical protein TrispH2_007114 [Trichoplax sp. H2]
MAVQKPQDKLLINMMDGDDRKYNDNLQLNEDRASLFWIIREERIPYTKPKHTPFTIKTLKRLQSNYYYHKVLGFNDSKKKSIDPTKRYSELLVNTIKESFKVGTTPKDRECKIKATMKFPNDVDFYFHHGLLSASCDNLSRENVTTIKVKKGTIREPAQETVNSDDVIQAKDIIVDLGKPHV